MANKNTLRKRAKQAKSNKRGHAVDTDNGGKFQPRLTSQMEDKVSEIREHTKRLYGGK